jgi:hypothetical protein
LPEQSIAFGKKQFSLFPCTRNTFSKNKEPVMKNKYVSIALIFTVLTFALMQSGCDLEPGDSGPVGDGILIYSGSQVLNGKTWEIVTNRVQQLRASVSSGHTIEWSSSDHRAVFINSTSGRIRAGNSPGQTAVITATSVQDPLIQASVTFRTRGLR